MAAMTKKSMKQFPNSDTDIQLVKLGFALLLTYNT
jgi:hypothetical protein